MWTMSSDKDQQIRFKNTATKRKGYWKNISNRQCRNEIKNKHTGNHNKTKGTRRKGTEALAQ